MNLVDLVKSVPTSIYLQKSASIQPRSSLSKVGGKLNSLFIRLLSHLWYLLLWGVHEEDAHVQVHKTVSEFWKFAAQSGLSTKRFKSFRVQSELHSEQQSEFSKSAVGVALISYSNDNWYVVMSLCAMWFVRKMTSCSDLCYTISKLTCKLYQIIEIRGNVAFLVDKYASLCVYQR